MKAICYRPVQLYDAPLAGTYDVGDALEGDKAVQVLEKYPDFFVPEKPAEGRKSK